MAKDEQKVQPKIDRMLFEVHYITWMPADARMAAQGEIPKDQKVAMGTLVWAPIAVDEADRPKAELLLPEEQGFLWAQKEIIRKRPDGREVLAITACKSIVDSNGNPVRESVILNQPKSLRQFDNDLGLGKDLIDQPATKKPSLIIPGR